MDIQLDQLRALSAAVTEGTFEAAARSLRITPSALSQRIKSLEESVGRILLQRVKPVHATESGLSVLRLARQFDLLAADTVRELGGDEPGGDPVRVPIAVNADSLETWVLPALAEVSGDVCFEIVREDQEHTTARLRDGTVMAAITSTAEPVQGCVVRGLGSMRYRPMASPGFAAAWFGSGPTAADYSAAPVVIFDRKDELQDQHLRRRTKRKAEPPRHYVPSSAGYADAVRLGLGWGMLPDLQTGADVTAGRLIEIDPGAHMDVPLYWQQWKLDSAALSAVAAAIESAGATVLLPTSDGSRHRLKPRLTRLGPVDREGQNMMAVTVRRILLGTPPCDHRPSPTRQATPTHRTNIIDYPQAPTRDAPDSRRSILGCGMMLPMTDVRRDRAA